MYNYKWDGLRAEKTLFPQKNVEFLSNYFKEEF